MAPPLRQNTSVEGTFEIVDHLLYRKLVESTGILSYEIAQQRDRRDALEYFRRLHLGQYRDRRYPMFRKELSFVPFSDCVPQRPDVGAQWSRYSNTEYDIVFLEIDVQDTKPSLLVFYHLIYNSLDQVEHWPNLYLPDSDGKVLKRLFYAAVESVQHGEGHASRSFGLREIEGMINNEHTTSNLVLYVEFLRYIMNFLERIIRIGTNSYGAMRGYGRILIPIYNRHGAQKQWERHVRQLGWLYNRKIQIAYRSSALVDMFNTFQSDPSVAPILADVLMECGASKDSEWFLDFLREADATCHFNMGYAAFRQLKGELSLT